MTEHYVDPDKLQEFILVLNDFSKHSEKSLESLNGQLRRLQNSWRDQEFERFAAHVRRTEGHLKAFAAETAKTVPLLQKDVEIMKAYQKLHITV